MIYKYILLFIFIISFINLHSQPIAQKDYKYVSIKSQHFYIHFPEQFIEIAIYFLNISENIHKELENKFKIDNRTTHLVLIFNNDIVNSYATVYGIDTIIFFLKQPDIGDFSNYKDWFRQLILHEYIHIILLRSYKGFLNYTFRFLFGFPPNLALPDGITEGISVIEESQPITEGRLFNEDTNSIIRNQLLYNKFPSMEEILGGSYYWPLGEIPYLYGSRYLNSVINNSSKEQVISIFYSSKLPIFLQSRFSENQLDDIEEYYKKFKENEYTIYKEWFIKKSTISFTPYQQLTYNGGFKKYLRIYNNNLYYFEKSSYRTSGIYMLNQNNTNLFYRSSSLNSFYIDKNNIITSEPRYINGNNIINYNLYFNKKEILEYYTTTRKSYPIVHNKFLIYIEYQDPYISIVKIPLYIKNNYIILDHKRKYKVFETNFLNFIDYPIVFHNQIYFIFKRYNSYEYYLFSCNIDDAICKPIFRTESILTTLYPDYENNRILFSSSIHSNYEAYSYDPNTNKIYLLTNSFLNIKNPVYFKNYLYFIGETYKGYEIFRIPTNILLYKDFTKFFDFNIKENNMHFINIETKTNIQDYQLEEYNIFHFRFFLDGLITNSNSELALQISGVDPLSRYFLNFGAGLVDIYTLYFFSFSYNRFLPNVNFSFIRTNPFHSDKNCFPLLNDYYRNQLCKLYFGFESYNLNFSFPYFFRLIKTISQLGFIHKKNINSFYNSNAIYQYNNFIQNSIYFIYNIFYYENYYYSISPEKGFNFKIRIEHYPYTLNFIRIHNSIEKSYINYSYTNYSFLLEVFLPWIMENHVPYFSLFTTFNKGKNYDFVQNKIAMYQQGISIQDSTYGSGSIVFTSEYRFPLLYSSKRLLNFLPQIGIHWISISPFYQIGKNFNKDIYENNRIFYTKGIRLQGKLYAFYLPFFLNIIYAKGTEEQISFGFSLNTDFHMQFLQHLQHPEYLLPTWNYK